MREGEDGMALELETNEEAQGLLAPPSGLSIRPSPSSTSSRQHLSVTILELSSSPGAGGYGLDSDPEKLSFLSNVSPGGLEPPILMTPCGATPERRESNNSTRSTRSFAGGGSSQQQPNRGSDVILADSNSDTFGPGVKEMAKASYSMDELIQAATWAVSYRNEKEYARRFRLEFNKDAPDQKIITMWKKDLLQTGLDPRTLLQERTNWETRYLMKEHRRAGKATFQGQVYNFLERPTGWKCFMYHISVPQYVPQVQRDVSKRFMEYQDTISKA